jgi:hypothetical protein
MDHTLIDGPAEPLAVTAPLAWSEAPRLCYVDAAGNTCLWYHKVWQYLRLLGVISTVRTNTGFLVATLRELARAEDQRRVLISASADYSMLAHVAYAYALEARRPDVTVVDRCRTSLFLNAWYAQHIGLHISTECADLLTYQPVEPFDVVCTHNLMGRFDVAGRERLVQRWHVALRSGGAVMTTQRVRPRSQEARVRYRAEEARALASRVETLASDRGDLGVDAAELAEAVYRYAIDKDGYVIAHDDELIAPLRRNGFDVVVAERGSAAERAGDRPSSTAGTDTYRLRIVARKR